MFLIRRRSDLKTFKDPNVIGLYFSTISKMTSPFVLHDVLTGVYSIVGSKYNIVVKGIDMHEAGTLNPTYYDGIIVLSQRTEDRHLWRKFWRKRSLWL